LDGPARAVERPSQPAPQVFLLESRVRIARNIVPNTGNISRGVRLVCNREATARFV